MQFVADGPNIPDEISQELEDETLVLFCGAGLSMASGLPDFRGLVKQVIKNTGVAGVAVPEDGQFLDRVLGAVENKTAGDCMRQAVIKILRRKPKPNSLISHRAVLDLSRLKDGCIRCVTTNFDDLFARAAYKAHRLRLRYDTAPTLPVPNPVRWASLVYLHGRIDPEADPNGRHLVLTSSDFGRAYLTEAWASRFMTELFRHFSVLFIGYSIEDPVMRYLLDALAADRQLGTGPREAYALVGYPPRKEAEIRNAWESRGVRPIFYRDDNGHVLLHQTLHQWAEQKRGGLTARAQAIKSLAPNDPETLEPGEPDKVVWALAEPSGYCARAFSTLEPPAPLSWLPVLAADQRLCVKASEAPYGKLISPREVDLARPLNAVPRHLAAWMARHLADPYLLRWVLEEKGLLHPDFREIVRRTLAQKFSPLPRAVTRVWEILAADPPVVRWSYSGYCDHIVQSLHEGTWNETIKIELLKAMEPYLKLSPASSALSVLGDGDDPSTNGPVSAFVAGEVLIRARHQLQEIVDALTAAPGSALVEIAHDLTSLLRQVFDLYAFLGRASDAFDLSHIIRPSIAPHAQNTHFEDWTAFVDLLVAAFERTDATDVGAAHALVARWTREKYPVFRRLALHAVTASGNFTSGERLELLL